MIDGPAAIVRRVQRVQPAGRVHDLDGHCGHIDAMVGHEGLDDVGPLSGHALARRLGAFLVRVAHHGTVGEVAGGGSRDEVQEDLFVVGVQGRAAEAEVDVLDLHVFAVLRPVLHAGGARGQAGQDAPGAVQVLAGLLEGRQTPLVGRDPSGERTDGLGVPGDGLGVGGRRFGQGGEGQGVGAQNLGVPADGGRVFAGGAFHGGESVVETGQVLADRGLEGRAAGGQEAGDGEEEKAFADDVLRGFLHGNTLLSSSGGGIGEVGTWTFPDPLCVVKDM